MPASKKKQQSRKVVRVSPALKPLALFDHQQRVEDAYKEGLRRFFLGWHRRAGKDVFAMDFVRRRMQERVGAYWHLFPFHVQAKRAIWKGIDGRTGQRFIDRAFPKSIRHGEMNDTEMSLCLATDSGEPGSTYQMLGSDNYDRLVGSNPVGIIFSEWALCDPAAWDYIRPILIENKGWALFITTFRGRNHAWRMFNTVKELETWFAEIRTIEQTHRHDGSPIVTPEDIAQEIREGMRPELVQQEFYCNPDAATTGAIFFKQYSRLLQLDPRAVSPNNRILRIAWGRHEEGIAAIAFQGSHIVGVHPFLESNLTDAVQAVARRHPHTVNVHHAVNPDPTLFNVLDGSGIVASPISTDVHMMQGHAAAMLNTCSATSIAREALADFSMSFAPYRDSNRSDDDMSLTHDALMQALAVMHSAQPYSATHKSKPLDYSQYDRGIV